MTARGGREIMQCLQREGSCNDSSEKEEERGTTQEKEQEVKRETRKEKEE